jgi:hypothetical protein
MTPTAQVERKWRREAKASRLASLHEAINGRTETRGRLLPPLFPQTKRPPPHADDPRRVSAGEPELTAAALDLSSEALALLGSEFRSTGPKTHRNAGYQKGAVMYGSRHSPG